MSKLKKGMKSFLDSEEDETPKEKLVRNWDDLDVIQKTELDPRNIHSTEDQEDRKYTVDKIVKTTIGATPKETKKLENLFKGFVTKYDHKDLSLIHI